MLTIYSTTYNFFVALALNRSITIEIENFIEETEKKIRLENLTGAVWSINTIEETEKKIRLEKAGVRHD